MDAEEGGRAIVAVEGPAGGSGDVERGKGVAHADPAPEPEGVGIGVGNTDEMGGRALRRDEDVGMVSRRAAGLEDGVEGRVGGTLLLNSNVCSRLVELVCVLAREDAVGASYRPVACVVVVDVEEVAMGAAGVAVGPDPEPDACV